MMWSNWLRKLFPGRTTRKGVVLQRKPIRYSVLRVEQLEDKIVPSSLTFSSGSLNFTTATNDIVTVSVSGNNYIFNDATNAITNGGGFPTGWSGFGTSTVTGPSAGVTGSITANLNGTGASTLDLRSSNAAVFVNTGTGADAINIASDAGTDAGNLLGILKTVTITAGGAGSSLTVSNYGATSDSNTTVGIGSSAITGFAGASGHPVEIDYGVTGDGSYSAINILGSLSLAETFNVNNPSGPLSLGGSGGADVYNVNQISYATSIKGGTGADTFTVGTGGGGGVGLDQINAPLTIDGGGGTTNTLTLNDLESAAVSTTVGVTATTITGLAGGNSGRQTVTYKSTGGAFSSVAIQDSDAQGDTYNISGVTPASTLNVFGNGGNDTMNVTASVKANLSGGAGNDTFTIASGKILTGAIDGGAGTDTLDLSATSPTNATLTGSVATGYTGASVTGVTGGFTTIDVLKGGLTGTLTGENDGTSGTPDLWTLNTTTATTTTYTDTASNGNLVFTGFSTLQGGSGVDSFAVNTNYSSTLNGGLGNDIFSITAGKTLTGTINGQDGNDSITIGAAGVVTGTVNGDGTGTVTAGSDTLTLGSANATLNAVAGDGFAGQNSGIDGGAASGFTGIDTLNGSGTLTGLGTANGGTTGTWTLPADTYAVSAGTLTFGGFGTLQGSDGVDTFNVTDNSTENLNGGLGNDVFSITAGKTLTGTINGQDGNDSITIGAAGVVTGTVNGDGTGTVTAGSDTLTLGSANATLNAVAGDGFAGQNSGIDGGAASGFTGIDTLNGSGTLTGLGTANGGTTGTWTLPADTYAVSLGTLTFGGFGTLQGSDGVDTFNVTDNSTENLNGGLGNDVFSITAGKTLTGTINGQDGNDSITIGAAGVVTGTVNGDGTGTITPGSDTLTLGSANATLNAVAGDGFAGQNSGIDGGAASGFTGIDTLNGSGTLTGLGTANGGTTGTWTLPADTYAVSAGTLTFGGFGTLQGSDGVDTFNVTDNSTENLNGGLGNDVFSITAGKTLTGTINGQDGNDSITIGAAGVVTGTVNGDGTGTVTAGSDTLTLGSANATLNAVAGDGFAGQNSGIDGGAASGFTGIDTLNGSGTLTGLGTANGGTTGTWTLPADTYAVSAGTLTFGGFGTLQGSDGVDTFNVTDNSTENLNGGLGNDVFSITAGKTLTGTINGQDGNDSITIGAAGVVTGTVNGDGTGTVTAGSDTLTLGSANATLNAVAGDGFAGQNSGVDGGAASGFTGIDTLNGSGTLTGLGTANGGTTGTWTLPADTYAVSAGTLTFGGFGTLQGSDGVDTFNVTDNSTENLNGGLGNDVFSITAGKTLTGTINGQDGNDSITIGAAGVVTGTVNGDGTGTVTAGSDTLTLGSANATLNAVAGDGFAGQNSGIDGGAASGFTGIDTLNGSGTLTGLGTANGGTTGTWTLPADTYAVSAGTLTFGGFGTLQGSDGVDTFNVTDNSTENLNGGLGNDVFSITAGKTLTGTINGQDGNDSITIGAAGVVTGTVNGDGTGTVTAGSDTLTLGSANATLNAVAGDGFAGQNSGIDGGAASGFTGIDTLNGSGTLTGLGTANGGTTGTWTLPADTYAVSAGTLTFGGFGTLQGSDGVDTFNVTTNASDNLNGGLGNDVFTISTGAALTGNIAGQAGADTISIDGTGSVVGTVSGDGTGTGNDTLNLTAVDVTLTGVTGVGGFAGTNSSISGGFDSINILNGNGTLTGLGTGNGGTTGTWSLPADTYAVSTNTLFFGGFGTLQGSNGVDTFNVSADTSENLNGGLGNDIFNVADGATLTGNILGQDGNDTISINGTGAVVGTVNGDGTGTVTVGSDTLNLAATDATLTAVAPDGFAGTNSSISAGFTGIDTLNGSGTLTGLGTANGGTTGTWTLPADTYAVTGGTLTFGGFGTLQGSDGVDTFNVTDNSTENLNGGLGNDVFSITAGKTLTGTINGQDGNDSITIGAAGVVTGTVNGDGTGTVTAGSDTLTLGSANATLNAVAGDGFAGQNSGIDGGAASGFTGIDTLNGSGTLTGLGTANGGTTGTWTLPADTYAVSAGTLTFGGFGTLQGSDGVDTFNVTDNSTENLNGGLGNDVFSITAGKTLTGTINGQDGNDSITIGAAGVVTGTVNGDGTGTVTAGSDTLTLGSANATLNAVAGDGFAGQNSGIDGGAASGFTGIDTLNGSGTLTGLGTANGGTTGTWTLPADTYAVSAGTLTFGGFGTLQGSDGVDTFNVTDNSTENLNGGLGDDVFSITAAKTLTGTINGQDGDDSITIGAAGVVTGTVNGDGTGTVTAGSDTLTLGSADATLNAVAGDGFAGQNSGIDAGAASGFTGIDTLNGSGTLTGLGTTNGGSTGTWTLPADTYAVTGGTLTFGGFGTLQGSDGVDTFNVTDNSTENLNGGAGDDIFSVSANKTLTGNIDGGDGDNTITVAGVVAGTVNGDLSGASPGLNTLSFAGQPLAVTVNVTGTGASGFSGGDQGALIITGGFTGIATLVDSGNGDTFKLGAENMDALNGGFLSRITIDGSGSSTLALLDSSNTEANTYTIDQATAERTNGTGTLVANFSNIANVTVQTGTNSAVGNTINLETIPSTLTVNLSLTTTSSNTLNIGTSPIGLSNSLFAITGTVNFINISGSGLGAVSAVNIYDGGSAPGSVTWTLGEDGSGNTTIERNDGTHDITLHLAVQTGFMDIAGGAADNHFLINATAQTITYFYLDGGTGNSTVTTTGGFFTDNGDYNGSSGSADGPDGAGSYQLEYIEIPNPPTIG